MSSIDEAADIAMSECMALVPHETALVITDEPARVIGKALFEAAVRTGAETLFLEITPRASNGEEPPAPVAALMKLVDVILIPTSKSLSHTDSRREASRAGVRIATLPGITEDMMVRTLNADYAAIARRSDVVAGLITEGSTVTITAPGGTDISMSIVGRPGLSDTGLNHEPGSFSNLPAGEGYTAPVEGSAEGVIVVDGSMAGVGLLTDEAIGIEVEGGNAREITGGPGAERLRAIMEPHGPLAFNLAELGIGTHDKALITGNVLEDEKVMGTVHLAFGDNKSMGGTIRVASHLDGVILSPTLAIDGRVLIERGTLLVD